MRLLLSESLRFSKSPFHCQGCKMLGGSSKVAALAAGQIPSVLGRDPWQGRWGPLPGPRSRPLPLKSLKATFGFLHCGVMREAILPRGRRATSRRLEALAGWSRRGRGFGAAPDHRDWTSAPVEREAVGGFQGCPQDLTSTLWCFPSAHGDLVTDHGGWQRERRGSWLVPPQK